MSGVRIFTLQKDNIWIMLMHDAVYMKTIDVIHYRSFCLDFEGTDNHYMQPGICPRVLSLPPIKEGVQPAPLLLSTVRSLYVHVDVLFCQAFI